MQNAAIQIITKPNGSKSVHRTYPYDVPAYSELKEHNCINLPKIYSAQMQNGFFVVEEEFIDGISLQEMLDAGEQFTEADVCRIGIEICKALSFMHERGFIHRDIKPEHILLTADDRIVLIDLDASMHIVSEKKVDTQLLGTPGYAAPEQFGLARSDRRTDIYETGILLNELLTGVHPVVNRYKDGKIGKIIERCTRMNLDERYQTAKELSEALHDALNKKTSEAHPAAYDIDTQNKEAAPHTEESAEFPTKQQNKTNSGTHTVLQNRKFAAVALLLLLSLLLPIAGVFTAADSESGLDNETDSSAILNENDTSGVIQASSHIPSEKKHEKLKNGMKQLYIGNETVYYNSRLGCQSAELWTEDGELIDESYEVWTDKAVGYIEGWDDYYNGWTLVSQNCKMGAEGYLYARKEGTTYAIRVVVTGEPMSAYTDLPDFDDLTKNYIKPAGRAVDSELPNQIFVSYTPGKPITLYLVAMHYFNDVLPICKDADTEIALYEGSANWYWPIYKLTFDNPAGGDREIEVRTKHNNLVFCFTDITAYTD